MFDSGRNLTYTLAHLLGGDIVSGQYAGINFPTETQLATQFQVSRNLIREVVKILAAKGLLVSKPGRGITILPSHTWNIFDTDVLGWAFTANPDDTFRELFQLQNATEPEAARLASENTNIIARHDIRVALDRIAGAVGTKKLLQAKNNFHTAIFNASGNPYFLQIGTHINKAHTLNGPGYFFSPELHPQEYQAYKEAYGAISSGNSELAIQAIKHLLHNFTYANPSLRTLTTDPAR